MSVFAGLAVVMLLLVYAGPGSVWSALSQARLGLLMAATGSYATFFLARAWRWRRLLGPPASGVRSLAACTAIGWTVSSYVPFKAGDVTRTALVARERREPFSVVAGTVALERALDVLGLAFAATVGMALAAVVQPGSVSTLMAEAVAVAWILPLAGLLLLVLLARALPAARGRHRLAAFLDRLLEATRRLTRRPREGVPLALLTLASTGALVCMFVFLVQALRPDVPWLVAAMAVPLFLLSFVVALTPGHVGTYEAAFVAVFALFGTDTHGLLSTALAMHVLSVGIVTTLGGLGFALHRLQRPDSLPTPRPLEARM